MHPLNHTARRGVVTEDDTAFPKETGESLMSKTNLTGHSF